MAYVPCATTRIYWKGETRITIHRAEHHIILVEHREWLACVIKHQSAAIFFKLREFIPALFYLLANSNIGVKRLEPGFESFRWSEIFHVQNYRLPLPFDRVVRALTFICVLLLELERDISRIEIRLKEHLAGCVRIVVRQSSPTRAVVVSPAPRLQQMSFIKRRHSQPFHRSYQILADFK